MIQIKFDCNQILDRYALDLFFDLIQIKFEQYLMSRSAKMSTKMSTKRDFSTLVPNDSKSSADANSAKRIRTGGLNTVETDKNSSPANSVISENESNTNPLLDGLVIPSDGPHHDSKSNVAILATYESETITRVAYGHKNGRVSVISWGSIENVKALIEDGLLSTASNWELVPNKFKEDVLATTAIEKNPYVLEYLGEEHRNQLNHSLLASAIKRVPCCYKHLSVQQKQRKDFVILCLDNICERATYKMEFIPDVFKRDIDVVLLLIRKYAADRPDIDTDILPNPYEWCDQELFWKPLFAMQAVREDYGIMSHVRSHHTEMYERLQDNKPFVMHFISTYKGSWDRRRMMNPLQYVSERLRDDQDVLNQVAQADDSNGSIYQDTLDYASKRLCESPDFVIGILEYLPIEDVDPDEMRLMLARNCPFLSCDIEFIKRTINDIGVKHFEMGPEAILWFDEWFRKDKSAVKAIMEVNPLVVAHVSDDLKDTLCIIKPHFCECPSDELLDFASKRVRDFVVSMKDLYVEYKEALRTRTDGSDDHITVYNQIIAKHDAFIKEKM